MKKLILFFSLICGSVFGQGIEPNQLQPNPDKNGILKAVTPYTDPFTGNTEYLYEHETFDILCIDSIKYYLDTLRVWACDTLYKTEIISGGGSGGAKWFNGSGAPSGIGQSGDYYLNTSNGDVYEEQGGTWVPVGNIRGPTGSTGATGQSGNTWYSGTATPTGGLGVNGDFYLNTVTWDVYKKIGGSWVFQGNIKGATGSPGSPGSPGADGSVWYNGFGMPSVGLGINGDYYFELSNSDIYVKSGGSWSWLTNIKGAPGATGSTGAPGSKWHDGIGSPSAGLGVSGDYYLNISNGDVYVKSGAIWSGIGNIRGPQGIPGSGSVTSIATSAPITGGTITTSGTIGLNINTTSMEVDGSSRLNAKNTTAIWNANQLRSRSISITAPTSGQVLKWNGSAWTPSSDNTGPGTVTSVGLTTGTLGTNINVTGSPITSSGSFTLNIPTASGTNRGALSSTDWTTFNSKIGGSGANTRVAYYSGASTLTSNSGFTFASSILTTPYLRITNPSGTPISIIGRNGSGDVGSVTVGSGLSLSSGVLSATGGGSSQNLSYGTKTGTDIPLNISSGVGVTVREGKGIFLDRTASNVMTIVNKVAFAHMTRSGSYSNISLGSTEVRVLFTNYRTNKSSGEAVSYDNTNKRLKVNPGYGGTYRINYDVDIRNASTQYNIEFYVKISGNKDFHSSSLKVVPPLSSINISHHFSRNFFAEIPDNGYIELFYIRTTGSGTQIDIFNPILSIEYVNDEIYSN